MRTRRTAITAVLLLMTSVVAAQDATTPQDLFRRALALHDAGDFSGAIAIYKTLLAAAPDNDQVKYELTYSIYAKGDTSEAIRRATEGGSKAGRYQSRYLELLGNAYEAEHRPGDAVAAYKRGIKADVNYPGIHLNLGIAYAAQNKYRDARGEFERAITLDPNYASPQYFIAMVYRNDGYRIPAILAYARFLSLERSTDRAVTAAKSLRELLELGVKAGENGNVTVTLNPDAKQDLGNFSGLETMLAIVAAGRHLKDKAPMNEFDNAAETLGLFVTMFSEVSADFTRGFVGKAYVPFYTDMAKAGHASTFAHVAFAPLRLAGTDDWLASHKGDVASWEQWLQATKAKALQPNSVLGGGHAGIRR